MAQKEWDMQSLSEVFLQSVRSYGIKEVSMEQYEAVCKKIIRFSSEKGFRTYYQGLRADYDAWIDEKIRNQSICYEYGRFQHRVIRMMESLAETGQTDFSSCFHSPREYVVSASLGNLLKKHSITTH